jgi:peptide/nickel transport system permease protein
VTLIGISLHPMVIGVLLQTTAGNRWHLAPPGSYCPLLGKTESFTGPFSNTPPSCGGVADWAGHMALPWITFAIFFIALYMRMARARMIDVLGTDYVRSARAKGAPERSVLLRHAFPNAAVPLITMLAMDLGLAVGIAVYVETVFNLPGLGQMLIGGLRGEVGFDGPVIVAVVLVVGTAIIVLNLLADIAIALVDPTVERRGPQRARASAGVI